MQLQSFKQFNNKQLQTTTKAQPLQIDSPKISQIVTKLKNDITPRILSNLINFVKNDPEIRSQFQNEFFYAYSEHDTTHSKVFPSALAKFGQNKIQDLLKGYIQLNKGKIGGKYKDMTQLFKDINSFVGFSLKFGTDKEKLEQTVLKTLPQLVNDNIDPQYKSKAVVVQNVLKAVKQTNLQNFFGSDFIQQIPVLFK